VRNILISLVNKVATVYRGKDYKIDPKLPLSALVGYSFRRFSALSRCLLRGVVFSFDFKKLVFLGSNVELTNRSMISFGKGVTIGKGVIIDGLSVEGVIIGDGVSIGPYSIIKATGVLSDLGKGVEIGANSGFDAYTFIGASGGVKIGQNVICGQHVSFHSENHIFDRVDIPIKLQGTTRQGIIIEDDCWIGANVTFLDGAHIGRGSVVGAGAVVLGKMPTNSVIVGVPARVVKNRV